jgi:hypothetical protein
MTSSLIGEGARCHFGWPGYCFTPHAESMEVPMTSDIRVFLGTLAVSLISWTFLVAVVVPLCMPRP